VKPDELRSLLESFYQDKAALRARHVAAARQVDDYNVNNTYQYVIAREDMHLDWLRAAIADLGGTPPEVAPPDVRLQGRGDAAHKALFREDADLAGALIDRWKDRLPAITHARHRKMCQVVLGETMEHRRFFQQAWEGRDDLLGRRTGGLSTGGGVLSERWVE
jgi:Mn-containing catalase